MKKTYTCILLSLLLCSGALAARPAYAANNPPTFVGSSGNRAGPLRALNRAQIAFRGVNGPLSSAQEIIQLVNQVRRAANGLPSYNVDGALMAAAQSHSQYQASIGSTSHTGSGGSSVTSRAIAAGYGGGAAVSVVENVYSGMNASAQQAVNWWKNDGTHMATLISSGHTDAGAGMATADGVVYITLVVGAVTGAAGSAKTQAAYLENATGQPPQDNSGGQAGTTPAPAASGAATISTPGPDGSITHVVQSGQTLWAISALYKVSILEILSLNGLNDASPIYPGQKIKIKEGGELPTATVSLMNSEGTPIDPASLATATPAPTRTPTRLAALGQTTTTALSGSAQATSMAPKAAALERSGPFRPFGLDPLLVLIGAVTLVGAGLLAAGSLLNRGE